MNSSDSSLIKRLRPLLGTWVTVSVRGANPEICQRAISDAFFAVERVQRVMSAHDSTSDLGRLAASVGEVLEVDPWTYEVLSLSQTLSLLSNGAFDITIGNQLAQFGLLPMHEGAAQPSGPGSFRDIELMDDNRACLRAPCRLDLGGIAKGFAVDQATAIAKNTPGITDVVVNAGGDLRVDTQVPEPVFVQDPFHENQIRYFDDMTSGAVASSGGLDAQRESDWGRIVPFIEGVSRLLSARQVAVTVVAPTCTIADALTKIVAMAEPVLANQILSLFRARAWVTEA